MLRVFYDRLINEQDRNHVLYLIQDSMWEFDINYTKDQINSIRYSFLENKDRDVMRIQNVSSLEQFFQEQLIYYNSEKAD